MSLAGALVCCLPSYASWTQTNHGNGGGTGNPQSTSAFGAALTNGSVIVVSIARQTNAPVAPTDTATNTYTACGATGAPFSWNGFEVNLYYALNTHTTASNVVSEANSVGDYVGIISAEYTGNAASSVVRACVGQTLTTSGTTGQNVSSGNIGSSSGDLVYGTVECTSGTLTVGTSFTAVASGVTDEYITASGNIAATWNDNTSGDACVAIGVALKPAAAPGVTNPPHASIF